MAKIFHVGLKMQEETLEIEEEEDETAFQEIRFGTLELDRAKGERADGTCRAYIGVFLQVFW